jgi:hypothetical protein
MFYSSCSHTVGGPMLLKWTVVMFGVGVPAGAMLALPPLLPGLVPLAATGAVTEPRATATANAVAMIDLVGRFSSSSW